VPALTELADLHTLADAARHAVPLPIAADAEAEAVMNVSLDRTGLLLLGEVHGVRQTPRVIAALIELLDVRALALEWPAPLTSTVDTHRRTGVLDDHELLWLGDGRLTPGHLALLCDLGERRPAVEWLAFDTWTIPPDMPGESLWTARDHAMARRILAHTSPAGRTLVVAGNAHIPTTRTRLGIPMAAWLAQERHGLRSVQINYGKGAIYNMASKQLASSARLTSYRVRLDDDRLLLDHPGPEEADVPHRPTQPVTSTARLAARLLPRVARVGGGEDCLSCVPAVHEPQVVSATSRQHRHGAVPAALDLPFVIQQRPRRALKPGVSRSGW
jgi:hypothetical protein